MFRFTIRELVAVAFALSMWRVAIGADGPTESKAMDSSAVAEKPEAPTIEFQKLIEVNGQKVVCFRLTNGSQQIVRYTGREESSPSVALYTPHNLTRTWVNYFEHWSFCANCNRIRTFELGPGQSVECRVVLPHNLAPFRLATELLSEPNYSPLIQPE